MRAQRARHIVVPVRSLAMGLTLITAIVTASTSSASTAEPFPSPPGHTTHDDKSPLPSQSVVTVSTQPSGQGIYVDGTLRPTPYAIECGDDAIHEFFAPQWENRGPFGYSFSVWRLSDLMGLFSVSGQSVLLYCPASGTATAEFDTRYRVDVRAEPYEAIVRVDGYDYRIQHEFWCSPGERHTVVAPTPQESGSVTIAFASWSDGGARMHEITCDSPMNLTATFHPVEKEDSLFMYVTLGATVGAAVAALGSMLGHRRHRRRKKT